ncbi:MAG TPA: nuclear transport factor 2 family protein [Casimicrobiaceae bacterium]|jgi:ketosteroid isomerase-like protein
MSSQTSATETVVRKHLQAFVERKGVAAILDDYHDDARLYSEAAVYQGKAQIRDFFVDFIGSLPSRAVDQFALRSLRVEGDLAYITWSAGSHIPMATDTFVVRNGKITSQTFAMLAAAP